MSTIKKNNKNRGNKNHDVAGILCVIISLFFLICLVTPLLSDIGVFIKSLTMGIIGYLSYPIILCTLFLGILLLMEKKAVLSVKQIVYLVLMAVSAVFILQTALDAGKLGGSFGEYLSTLISFDPSNTTAGHSVGGVIFGVFAYAIKAALTFVGAYILYSLLFLLFGALFILDMRRGQVSNAKSKKREPQPFVKGQSVAQPVRDINDNSLFVGTIERTNKITSESGGFTSIYSPFSDPMPRYESAPVADQYTDQYEDDLKAQAKKILFGDAEEMFKSYEQQLKGNMNIEEKATGRRNYLIDDDVTNNFYKPNTFTAYPNINPAPKKVDAPKVVLPEVPVPPTKDISDQFIDGPILNGDEVSKDIEESNKQRRRESKEEYSAPEIPPIITGNPVIKSSQNEGISSSSEIADDTLPPIITGNPKVKNNVPKETVQYSVEFPPLNVREEDDTLPPIITGNSTLKKEPVLRKEKEVENLSPILNGDSFIKSKEPEKKEKEEEDVSVGYVVFRDEPTKNDDGESEKEEELNIASNGEEIEIPDDITEYETDGHFDGREERTENVIENESDVANTANAAAEELEVIEDEVVAHDDAVVRDEVVVHDDAIVQDENESMEISNESGESEAIMEAKIPDSLKLIDEEIDMSETSDEIDNDNTGYYSSEEFDNRVNQISLKLKDNVGIKSNAKDNNQIYMDDYDIEINETKPKKQIKHLRYTPPPIEMLNKIENEHEDVEDYEKNASNLEEALSSLKIDAKVINIVPGPAVTRYELELPPGQSVKRIPSCAEDIAYFMAASGKVRVEAPISGKKAVGVEIPNKTVSIVSLREIIDTKEFVDAKSYLTLGIGKDITGNVILCDLEKMPHLLIAGATGSGKSACLNSIIISMLYKTSPEDLRLILIDPKQVEFVLYRDMPHLLMKNIINDCTQAINAFKWAREEMDRRYTMFAKYAVRNLSEFNDCQAVKDQLETKLPRIVIIVDELAELMLAKNSKELEQNLMSMAQKARAAGMHLILATQRPSVDVLTGTIKANFPSRIAFAVRGQADSRTILDSAGAETLLGRGDMLYAPTGSKEQRVQGAFITTEEVENIVNFVRNNNETDYDEDFANIIMKTEEESLPESDEEKDYENTDDPLMKEVLRKVIDTGVASASQIQRKFAVGYNRAARIIDQMEENGFIGPLDGSKPREVYITRQKFMEIYGEDI